MTEHPLIRREGHPGRAVEAVELTVLDVAGP